MKQIGIWLKTIILSIFTWFLTPTIVMNGDINSFGVTASIDILLLFILVGILYWIETINLKRRAYGQ